MVHVANILVSLWRSKIFLNTVQRRVVLSTTKILRGFFKRRDDHFSREVDMINNRIFLLAAGVRGVDLPIWYAGNVCHCVHLLRDLSSVRTASVTAVLLLYVCRGGIYTRRV